MEQIAPPHAADDGTIDSIASWLLAHAQWWERPHQGAIAGTVGEDGRPDYFYPESAGYQLSWLAFLASTRPRLRASAAHSAGGVAAWIAGLDALSTRLTLRGPSDWRTAATFSFDLGMLARGLDAAAPLLTATELASARERVWAALDPLCEIELLACGVRPGHAVPERWSTLPGPYQLKPAAALMSCASAPLRVREAAAATVARWSDAVRCQGPLHPLLYACEGLVMLGERAAASRVLRDILALQRADGSLPESAEAPDSVARSDVLAQALRLAAGLGEGRRAQLDALEAALRRHVSRSGAVRFREHSADANVWCAHFAHQALSVRAGAPMHALV
jgi:hypothetical protein